MLFVPEILQGLVHKQMTPSRLGLVRVTGADDGTATERGLLDTEGESVVTAETAILGTHVEVRTTSGTTAGLGRPLALT